MLLFYPWAFFSELNIVRCKLAWLEYFSIMELWIYLKLLFY